MNNFLADTVAFLRISNISLGGKNDSFGPDHTHYHSYRISGTLCTVLGVSWDKIHQRDQTSRTGTSFSGNPDKFRLSIGSFQSPNYWMANWRSLFVKIDPPGFDPDQFRVHGHFDSQGQHLLDSLPQDLIAVRSFGDTHHSDHQLPAVCMACREKRL